MCRIYRMIRTQCSGLRDVANDRKDGYRIRRYTSHLGSQSRMAAGAEVIDGRPAMLPVSVDVSSIDIQEVRRAESPTEPVVATAERRQEFGGPVWLDDIDPELEVIPLLDSGTDCQDELSSPDGSPMVISPIVGLLPSQGEDDINLPTGRRCNPRLMISMLRGRNSPRNINR